MGYYELATKTTLPLSLVLGAAAVAGSVPPSNILRQVPAVYVFGDSTLDVGNNNYLPRRNVPRADRPYYGIDMPGSGKPNGRFSNGYNTADFVAKSMGFESSPPPYLSMASSSDQLVQTALAAGVSYASAGAGILDSTELYRMGARKFAIINVGLAWCLPIARVLSAAGACSDSRNKLAAGFNDALRSLLAGLAAPRLPGLVYSLADSYGIMATLFADPRASGFTDVSSACCGSGRLGVGGCLPTSTVCANHDQHYFWDGIHPSQQAALLRVQAFYNGPTQYTTPINFKELIRSTDESVTVVATGNGNQTGTVEIVM